MPAKNAALRALVPTVLLALVATLFLFSQAASAQPRPEEGPNAGPGLRGGVLGVPVLPGQPAQEERSAPEEQVAQPDPPAARGNDNGRGGDEGPPSSDRMWLTVPDLGIKNVSVGSSSEQSYLDREGIMHLAGTDFPWEEEPSNTYIAGHAIGYAGAKNPEIFRNLEDLEEGDRVTLRDADGETYDYKVYERLVVDPTDTWVTEPVEGKDNIVSMQTCWPEPSFEKRLVVRAKLVK